MQLCSSPPINPVNFSEALIMGSQVVVMTWLLCCDIVLNMWLAMHSHWWAKVQDPNTIAAPTTHPQHSPAGSGTCILLHTLQFYTETGLVIDKSVAVVECCLWLFCSPAPHSQQANTQLDIILHEKSGQVPHCATRLLPYPVTPMVLIQAGFTTTCNQLLPPDLANVNPGQWSMLINTETICAMLKQSDSPNSVGIAVSLLFP
jgi:hypothetical protein